MVEANTLSRGDIFTWSGRMYILQSHDKEGSDIKVVQIASWMPGRMQWAGNVTIGLLEDFNGVARVLPIHFPMQWAEEG